MTIEIKWSEIASTVKMHQDMLALLKAGQIDEVDGTGNHIKVTIDDKEVKAFVVLTGK